MRVRSLLLLSSFVAARPLGAQVDHLELKWMRDSDEFAGIVRQTYVFATQAVERHASALPAGTPWAVVLDVDETVLDNQVYQLERAAYHLPFDTASWNTWVRREQSAALPGVDGFLARVRALGGRVAFITDRGDMTADATRANLAARGFWREGDRLCPLTADRAYTKRARRAELRAGSGRCAYQGEPVRILAYLGDNIADLPAADEEPGALGENWFLLPNPSYGSWERRVTRGSRFK